MPKFNDATITELYRKIFINKPTVTTQFDMAAIAKSPIKYFDAVLSLTDGLLDTLQQFEAAQKEIIAENLSITLKLNAQFIANPNLTAEKILSVKAQAERFFTRLDEINAGNDSICELAALAAEPRADFLSRIITDAQRKVNFFTANKNLVANVVKLHSVFAAWYDDWRTKRFALEQRFLPLAEFALKGNLSDAFEPVLNILRDYRDAVDKFYLHERKTIYQKFAFQAGGDLQEKFETESRLYNLAEKFQHNLQEIIFARDKTEERIFLLRWAEPLLNLPIDELSDFIHDRELDAISHKRETEYNALIFRMRKDLNR